MALYSRIHSWVTGEVLTASDLNAEFNNVLTNSKSDSIIGTSGTTGAMQTTVDPGGVGSESLASNVTGELQRLRFAINRIVGGAQWYASAGRSLTALAVGRADMAAMGQQLSSSCGLFSSTGGSSVDVTNLTVTITTTGRPVFLGLISDGSNGSAAMLGAQVSSGSSTFAAAFFNILRSTTIVASHEVDVTGATSNQIGSFVPVSSLWHIDVPAAGTYTYKVQITTFPSITAYVEYAKLIAYEMA